MTSLGGNPNSGRVFFLEYIVNIFICLFFSEGLTVGLTAVDVYPVRKLG